MAGSVNTQLVTVTIDPDGTPLVMTCVLSLGSYSQERAKTEYNCMSSDESDVGLGSITREPMEFTTLYKEDAADGQAELKSAFAANSDIQVEIEFDNAVATKGTALKGLFGVSKYVMDFPKDGKIGAAFTLEFKEAPTITDAV